MILRNWRMIMEKMKMHSISKIDENVKKLAELFPECVTEVINNTPLRGGAKPYNTKTYKGN